MTSIEMTCLLVSIVMCSGVIGLKAKAKTMAV